MTLEFGDLAAGMRLEGVVADGEVTVVAVEMHGPGSATLTYRTGDGRLGDRIIGQADLAEFGETDQRRWGFDADGAMFQLAAEAQRLQQAHLADPFAAVDTSNIEPYPHQIDAVYNRMLELRPLRFVLADDPGAGKTIMSGLLIRELMLRGDVLRCLIVAPGSLVEQWQDELWDKFGLSFELMSRAAVEDSRTGNPFVEKNLLIARVDQLSRSDDMLDRVKGSEWDLVIVDEAHKMSAHRYGGELKRTKRFILGEALRERTRHLLLLTATPHNGKDDDFLAFMTLVDPDIFEGQLRRRGNSDEAPEMPDTSGVMRRIVKENLRTFEGRRLFPERHAHSLNFELSPREAELYEAVTNYVSTGMNRALRMQEGGDRRGLMVGFALAGLQRRLASSPAAIHHSLRRRRDRLTDQEAELRRLAASGDPVSVIDLPRGMRIADLEDFDFDDYSDDERERLESQVIDAATASGTADELAAEVLELEGLVELADGVRSSREDTKWVQLRDLLRSGRFAVLNGQNGSGEDSAGHKDSAGNEDSGHKLIVFSEHKDTLTYLEERIAAELGRPDAVVVIHGGIKRHDRRAIQDRFRVDPTARVLVATDAAGEGVNLQAANMMVNYDLPWNPNRIEQRFGRIHRIGQSRPCHMWNLVAHETREGQVFQRLFDKIEQQRGVFGDQVYDVLGDSQINVSLRELLMRAIRSDADPAHAIWMDEVIEGDIGAQLEGVLKERALVSGLGDPAVDDEIRRTMAVARARRLLPWFVETFFSTALRLYGGRITRRESGRFEITRVPAAVRAAADPALGPVHDRYSRVTFDKAHIEPDRSRSDSGGTTANPAAAAQAELVSPGSPLLTAVLRRVAKDHGGSLGRGAILVDPKDLSVEPRLLVFLDHSVTDGRMVHGRRQVVSRRFQYVEIDRHGSACDPGGQPYLNYAPLSDEQEALLDGRLDLDWAGHTAEVGARDWAIEKMANPHFQEVRTIVANRIARVAEAVRERLEAEIRYWDMRTEEIKAQEIAGGKPRLNSGNARARADALVARLAQRRVELAAEADLHNGPPTVVGAALVVPQGLLDQLEGKPPDPEPTADKMETDRRAVAAVMKAERALGRRPEEQEHGNPGFDVLSFDPVAGVHYLIEVKGHLLSTEQISVSKTQVGQAQCSPDVWRLAVVSVPNEPDAEPEVRYLIRPFAGVTMHEAQTSIPLRVADLLAKSISPT
ncbi:MAG: helicase-related protein [Acidimicrobiaceae bacterium]|nr:helicase-related protein [Acidimicrobiaceae bacterium]